MVSETTVDNEKRSVKGNLVNSQDRTIKVAEMLKKTYWSKVVLIELCDMQSGRLAISRNRDIWQIIMFQWKHGVPAS